MGCGSSKKTTGVERIHTIQAEHASGQPDKKLKIPRGNIAKYSAWLKRFYRLQNTSPTAGPADEQAFHLQKDVDPKDLTPWRDEDTRIVCTRVQERVDPYFWNFSDGAQKVAHEVFMRSLRPYGTGHFDVSDSGYADSRVQYQLDAAQVPVNPASVAEYFESSLRHPLRRCSFCVQYAEMTFKFYGSAAWKTLPAHVIAEDVCTPEQNDVIARRSTRTDLHDPERMRKRRIALIRMMLKSRRENRYRSDVDDDERDEENALQPWLGWADRLEESWQKFQDLMTVNMNGNTNANIEQLTFVIRLSIYQNQRD